jgi:hypothetical protein
MLQIGDVVVRVGIGSSALSADQNGNSLSPICCSLKVSGLLLETTFCALKFPSASVTSNVGEQMRSKGVRASNKITREKSKKFRRR